MLKFLFISSSFIFRCQSIFELRSILNRLDAVVTAKQKDSSLPYQLLASCRCYAFGSQSTPAQWLNLVHPISLFVSKPWLGFGWSPLYLVNEVVFIAPNQHSRLLFIHKIHPVNNHNIKRCKKSIFFVAERKRLLNDAGHTDKIF